jgi:DNA-binding MarR family transcriptional regulator
LEAATLSSGRTHRVPAKRKTARAGGADLLQAPAEAILGYRLWQVHYQWHREIERQLETMKLTHLQYVLLAATNHLLNEGRVPSQTQLAQYTKIEKMMVSKNLRELEARGYVMRKPHPDNGRANGIDLTATGRTILRKAFAAASAAHATFFGAFGADWRKFDEMLHILMQSQGMQEEPHDVTR